MNRRERAYFRALDNVHRLINEINRELEADSTADYRSELGDNPAPETPSHPEKQAEKESTFAGR